MESLVRSREVLGVLTRRLGTDVVVSDHDLIQSYRFDRSNSSEAGMPLAVVRARCTSDVAVALEIAQEHRVPVVPRGAGTSLAGGSLAVEGCLVISTERMRAIEIHPSLCLAVAQPGALNVEVKQAAKQHGLWYPPDPSSYEICSIGGNVATNAGGICCVKYGVTTDYVLGLEVVLAGGKVLRLGGRTVKDVAGYDLKRLFVGSEGTLGIVTEVTLALRPQPPSPRTMVALFPNVAFAGRAVSAIVTHMRPAALELMDRPSVAAVEAKTRMGLDVSCGALLIGRSDSGEGRGDEEVAWMATCCQQGGASEVFTTADEEEGEQFMAARRMAIPAVEARGGTVLIEDVGVPVALIADLLAGIEAISQKHGVDIATIGHAGDGNFHPLVSFDPASPLERERAMVAFGQVMELAVGLGGTITGEHGVGTLKRPWLKSQIGQDALEIQKAIKALLDPMGIMNPGKAI
jgi:glycolate oxidase